MTSSLPCPSCPARLVPYRYRTLEVDVCTACRGMWLDAGELGVFVGYLDSDYYDQPGGTPKHPVITPADVQEPPKPCPRCVTPMSPFNYAYDSNIILDRCARCQGVWVDRGEFHKIILHTWHAAQGNR